MADYTQYDYDQLVQNVTDNVKNANGWGDAYTSSMGQTIIQTIAFTVDQLHYMMERRNQENYLPTAVLPSSVRSLANAHGYRPRRKVSARGQVELQLEDSEGNPVSTEGTINIPKYTQITWENRNFLTNEDVTIEPGESSVEFEIIEGSYQTYVEDPSDTTTTLYNHNYVLFEDYVSMEDNSVSVMADGDEFADVMLEQENQPPLEALSFASEGQKVYDIRIANDGMRIVFGSGLFGYMPQNPVTVSWVESSGAEISIRQTGLEFSFNSDTLTDDIQQTPKNTYYYTMTNIENIDGSLDEETVSDIRIKSPEYVRTGNRAVTKDDYVFWGKRSGIGGIVDVFTYGEEETGVTAFNMNNVYMTYLKQDGSQLTSTEQENLRSYMNDLKPITTHLVFKEAEIVPLQIILTVKRHPKLEISNSELHAKLQQELVEYFKFVEGSLAKDFFYSDLINHFHTMTIDKNNETYKVAQFVYATVNPLKHFSVPTTEPYKTDSSYDIAISIGDDGDVYSLELTYTDNNDDLQSAEVTYTQQSGDASSDVAADLQTQIDALNGLTCSISGSTITIDVENAGDEYTVSNRNSTQPANIPVEAVVNLHPRLINNSDNLDLFKPGTIEVLEGTSPYSVLATDDGAGSITYNGNSGSVNYKTGHLELPFYTKADYIVRYQQDNDEQNVFVNPKGVIDYDEAKEKINDADKLSTIEIMT